MVFHAIDKFSVTEVISDHRIIIYYIEGSQTSARPDKGNESTLCKAIESVMEMLKKKNDDLILVKVLYDSVQFRQFEEIYIPEVSGAVTLFAVNNVGIPVKCEHINAEDDIHSVIKSLSKCCKLNCIKEVEIPNISHLVAEQEMIPNDTRARPIVTLNSYTSTAAHNSPPLLPQGNVVDISSFKLTGGACAESENSLGESQPTSTELQIRLPNGNRDKQKFDREAMLQEVWIFISAKYKLKNFDLKTYNHQVFSEVEYEKSLQDLELYPNGVIIVVDKNIATFNSNIGFGAMIQLGFHNLITKSYSLFGYVHGLLFMFWNSLFFSNNRDGRPKQDQIKSSHKDSAQQSSSDRESKKHSSKKFGNIHTLRRNDDSDDENNRYNGNSTQQK